jgi:hypothetical protein
MCRKYFEVHKKDIFSAIENPEPFLSNFHESINVFRTPEPLIATLGANESKSAKGRQKKSDSHKLPFQLASSPEFSHAECSSLSLPQSHSTGVRECYQKIIKVGRREGNKQ